MRPIGTILILAALMLGHSPNVSANKLGAWLAKKGQGIQTSFNRGMTRVKGRVGFTKWTLTNKPARTIYRAEKKQQKLGKLRARLAINTGLTVADVAYGIKSANPYLVMFAGYFGLSALQNAITLSDRKATARFNTVNQAMDSTTLRRTIPKSVLRLHTLEAAKRLQAEQKSLGTAQEKLQAAQNDVTTHQANLPKLQGRLDQATDMLR